MSTKPMGQKMFGYEYDATDGLYHLLMFGRRNVGFRPLNTEAEAQQAVADMYEESRQADEAEIRYGVQ